MLCPLCRGFDDEPHLQLLKEMLTQVGGFRPLEQLHVYECKSERQIGTAMQLLQAMLVRVGWLC